MDDRTISSTEYMEDDDYIDIGVMIQDAIRCIRKYWWIMALVAILCSVAYGVYCRKNYTPMYKAKASFTVSTSSSDENYYFDYYYSESAAEQMASTFPHILESDLLKDLIKKDLGTDELNATITANGIKESNLFTITVTSKVPEDANAILESVINNFPNVARYVIGETKLNMIGTPTKADQPYNQINMIHKLGKGGIAGCVLDLIFIFLYAFFRKTIRKESQIKENFNFPCLGQVPLLPNKKRRNSKVKEELSIYQDRADGIFRETISSIALNIINQMEEQGKQVLMVTGTMEQEGTSTIANNVAYALSELGKEVIFLDAHLREDHEWDGPEKGLEEMLKGECSIKDTFIYDKKSHVRKLISRKALTAFEAANMQDVLKLVVDNLKKRADYIIIDAPSCEHLNETAMVSECAEALLYVIRQDYAKLGKVREAVEDLGRYDIIMLGCILNQVKDGFGGYGYGNRYGKYYGGYGQYSSKYGYGRYGRYGKYGKYGRYGHYGYGYGYGRHEQKQDGGSET